MDAALSAALRRLSPGDRAFLELSLRRGVADDEIGALLRLSHDEVRGRRERLLKRLAADVGSAGAAGIEELEAALGRADADAWAGHGNDAEVSTEDGSEFQADDRADVSTKDGAEFPAVDGAEVSTRDGAEVSGDAGSADATGAGDPASGDAGEAPQPQRRIAEWARSAAPATTALLLLTGGLTAYLGFDAGGFFPGGTAVATLVLCLGLVLRITLAERPAAGLGPLGAVATALLGAFALWTLLSAAWSDATARALIEFDRALLYLLACGLFASLPRTTHGVRTMLWGFAAGATAVCLVGLASRVLPDLVPTAASVSNERLAYPVTYWNALGMLAALGLLACFHIAAAERDPRVARALGAAAVPGLAVALFFTFSRGAIAVLPLALVVYAVVGRPRGLAPALLATVPPSVVALVVAHGADKLATENPTASAAASQAGRVALVTGLAIATAGLLRVALLPVDARLSGLKVIPRTRRAVLAGSAAVLVLAAGGAALALDAPEKLERHYDRFVEGGEVRSGGDARRRLTDAANNGRLDHWRVALDAYGEDRLRGQGAGTYEISWARERPVPFVVRDAHSLYLETLAELGIVGLVLLGGALLAIVGGVAWRIRGPDRALYAAIFSMGLAWLIRAGVDWDWEMPVITLWLFAIGGAVLARPRDARPLLAPPPRLARVVIGLLAIALALTPAVILQSQVELDRSVESFKRRDCPRAIDRALAASSALSIRPEPFEILAYCDVRLGRPQLGVTAMEEAVERDPRSWQLRYGLALVRAAAGRDPRSAARAARRLNPRSSLAQDAVTRFRTREPRTWKRRALNARLPIE